MQLLASATRTTSGEATPAGNFRGFLSAAILLNVTAAAAAAGDTLDVYVQHSADNGTTWDDFVHFTQVLGNGGAKKHQAFWSGLPTPEAELAAPTDVTMAVGVKQGPIGGRWKVKWVIAGSTPSFTFKVDADGRGKL